MAAGKVEAKKDSGAFVAIRMRGAQGARWKTKSTLFQLHLTRRYHATLLKASPQSRGMLVEASNYLAWGDADSALIEAMLSKRGEVLGGKRLTAEGLQNGRFKSLQEFAGALSRGEAVLKDVPGLKPVFRLHPPIGGHGSVKSTGEEGAVGFRKDISQLVKAMLE